MGFLQGVILNGRKASLAIEGGRIARIAPAGAEETGPFAGLLALPLFEDRHVHFDKAFPADRWLPRAAARDLIDQFRMEKAQLAGIAEGQLDRAREVARALIGCGVAAARVHVDADPEIGLRNFYNMLALREELRGQLDMELAVFPQQGLLRSDSVALAADALRRGADVVGAVDPGGVDGDVEGSLSALFRLAAEHGAKVDLHLHDPGALGLGTLMHMVELTRSFGMQGRVTASHAYCLGEIGAAEARSAAAALCEAGIEVVTSVPVDSAMPPVELLDAAGVMVRLGTDHTGVDAWTPFGDPDILKRGRLLAEKNRWFDDARMLGAYRYFARRDFDFAEGDAADFQLVRAFNPQHALAAAPARDLVLRGGVAVAGALADAYRSSSTGKAGGSSAD